MNSSPFSPHTRVRQDFPLLAKPLNGRRIIYLDNAATTLKPQVVVDAVNEYYLECTANIHRGKHYLSEVASDRYEDARTRVATFVRASSDEVIFVKNTTEALNVIALGLNLSPSDFVIGFTDSHHSQILPWKRTALELVRVASTGEYDLNHFEELLRRQPRVVLITACSNVTGCYPDLSLLIRMAKSVGSIIVIDGAQFVPHRRPNFTELDVDFLAFSAHKMLGPTGIGCLVGKRSRLEQLRPVYFGGGMVDFVSKDNFICRKLPHRLEAGTPPIEAAFGFAAAVDYLTRIGEDQIYCHDVSLGKVFVDYAAQRPYLSLLGPKDGRAAVASFAIPGRKQLGDLARSLSDSYGIMCRTGHLCAQPFVDSCTDGEVLRASAYLYNSEDDIKIFFAALDELLSVMGTTYPGRRV